MSVFVRNERLKTGVPLVNYCKGPGDRQKNSAQDDE